MYANTIWNWVVNSRLPRTVNSSEVINPAKGETIRKYPAPKNANEVRKFVAFYNFYRRFILNFAELAKPLNSLRRNGTFQWKEECQKSFENLKASLNPTNLGFNKTFSLTTDSIKLCSKSSIFTRRNWNRFPYLVCQYISRKTWH